MPRTPAPLLTMLPADALDAVARFVPEEDAFAFARASRACRAAVPSSTRTTCTAASVEHLQWKLTEGMPHTKETTTKAAADGLLDVLITARAVGLPFDESDAAVAAAKTGHMEVLQWLHTRGFPWNEHVCGAAAHGGHLDVLQWLCAMGCPWGADTCKQAANGGHVNVLEWLYEQEEARNCPLHDGMFLTATFGGHINVLEWLNARGCPWHAEAWGVATYIGNLHVLKWMHAQGCPFHKDACFMAANSGDLHILQWLHANGCPWDVYTADIAMRCRHFGVMTYMHEHGFSFGALFVRDDGGDMERWMRDHGYC
jgi:hypothetical protein